MEIFSIGACEAEKFGIRRMVVVGDRLLDEYTQLHIPILKLVGLNSNRIVFPEMMSVL